MGNVDLSEIEQLQLHWHDQEELPRVWLLHYLKKGLTGSCISLRSHSPHLNTPTQTLTNSAPSEAEAFFSAYIEPPRLP